MSENRRDDARTPDPGREHEPAGPHETPETPDTQVVETAGDTQLLDTSGDTRVLETSGDTQVVPHGATRVLPTPGGAGETTTAPVAPPEHDDEPEAQRSDVPLAVFDEPGPLPAAPGTAGPDAPPAAPGAARSTGYPAEHPAPSGYPRATAYGPSTGSAAPGPQPYGYVPTSGPQPAPYAPAEPLPAPPVSTAPRTGTIVWGLVILAVGLALVAVAAGARFDVGLGLIWLLGGAGLVLVVASVVGGVRRRNRADT